MTGELTCAKLTAKQGDGGLPLYLTGLLVPSPLYGNISLYVNTNLAKSEPFSVTQSFYLKYNPNVTGGQKKQKEKINFFRLTPGVANHTDNSTERDGVSKALEQNEQ